MDQDAYDNYLLDKAKELMQENSERDSPVNGVDDMPTGTEMDSTSDHRDQITARNKTVDAGESREPEDKAAFSDSPDPQEIEFLAKNRSSMDNDRLREFLSKDSQFHDDLESMDDFDDFSRWEERFLIQHHNEMDVDAIADNLDRGARQVRLKMRLMGFLEE